eukprot:CAMPEP_0183454102 /NCGR_PEP_ID=MMETSP0370-20130417/123002_1 /TAXON_ID=268820 /ORGANISM="Peridinium aciculiferum, Strain PAER-2" /LENGTH=41 /DNA_ID= /DNA_START= /DNA_END= /DNA_ORIENTATION=
MPPAVSLQRFACAWAAEGAVSLNTWLPDFPALGVLGFFLRV